MNTTYWSMTDRCPWHPGHIGTFNIIEDEDGETLWSYGHVPANQMYAEANRWYRHCSLTPIDDDDEPEPVEYFWARYDTIWGDGRFHLIKNYDNKSLKKSAPIFPVTRLRA